MVEMRKRRLTQIRAHGKSGTAELFVGLDAEHQDRLDRMIGLVAVQFRSLSSNVCYEGDKRWLRDIATSFAVMQ